MTIHWPLCIAIVAGVTPVAAQLTPQQRLEWESKAVRNTIGQTRQVQTSMWDNWIPIHRVGCGERGGQVETGCAATAAGEDNSWRRALHPRPVVATHWVGLASGPLRREELHPLGVGPLELKAGTATVMTLSSTIGGVDRALMIRTAVRIPAEALTWSWMGELTGDPQGRYLVTIPALTPGTYQLDIQVYDPDQPTAPASATANRLIVR